MNSKPEIERYYHNIEKWIDFNTTFQQDIYTTFVITDMLINISDLIDTSIENIYDN